MAKQGKQPLRPSSDQPATAARKKVRADVDGYRAWVFPCDKDLFMSQMRTLRAAKRTWTPASWKAAVKADMIITWGASKHGGRREQPTEITPSHSVGDGAASISCAQKAAIADRSLVSPAKAARGAVEEKPAREEAAGGADAQISSIAKAPAFPPFLQLLHACPDLPFAQCQNNGAVAALRSRGPSGMEVPFTPQPVVNFLYQVMACTIATIQDLLGQGNRFEASGSFVNSKYGPASGGQVVACWGTEIGSRRDQGLIAWDYDADLCVFKTPDCDFAAVWASCAAVLEPLGLRLIEHCPGFKYRIAPLRPLAFNYWLELNHETRLENPGIARCDLLRMSAKKKKAGFEVKRPSGCNCIDVEVYTVRSNEDITFQGTKPITVSPDRCFPIVEGIFGPLRVPLMCTPHVLDQEYGVEWRTTRVVKSILGNSRSKPLTLNKDASIKRCAWPSVPLIRCDSLLGGFWGAGVDPRPADIPWRFLEAARGASQGIAQ